MASATFEDHPTDPDKMILRKPRLDQGADYERGFVDGMQYQMQSSVDKAVNAMSQRTWVGLTDEDKHEIELRAGITEDDDGYIVSQVFKLTEAKLKELNS